MAVSSSVYFTDPSKIPVSGKTAFDLSPDEAKSEILRFQAKYARQCLVKSLESLLGFPVNYEDISNFLKNSFNHNNPVNIAFTKGGSGGGHVVVSYKIVDFNTEKRIYIYDVNLPDEKDIFLKLTKLPDDSYYFEGYQVGEYFFDRFEPFEIDEESFDPSRAMALFDEYIKQKIGELVQQGENLFSLNCPADAIIQDNYGRKIGIQNNQQINEIPSAKIIAADSVEIYELPNNLKYTATIVGLEPGKANINMILTSNEESDEIRTITFNEIPLMPDSRAQFNFSFPHTDNAIKIDLNNDGNFEQIKEVTLDTSFSITKPIAPSNLMAKVTIDHKVLLQWADHSDNEYAFILERKSSYETSYKIIANVKSNSSEFLDETEKADSVYYYRIKAITPASESEYSNDAKANVITDVKQLISQVPFVFKLSQNYPNPFNALTIINYQLPQPGNVILTIYNATGQKIIKLIDEDKGIGNHKVTWNALDSNGKFVSSGIYFYKIEVTGENKSKFINIKKLLLIK